MSASRKSFTIKNLWIYETYHRKINFEYIAPKNVNKFIRINKIIWIIFKCFLSKYERKCFLFDNFKHPYQKLNCKLFKNHKYIYDSEDNLYFCEKCYNRITPEEHIKYIRFKKLKNIL